MAVATDKEKEIHRLIMQGDDLAFAKLCDAYYEPVINRISAYNPWINTINEMLVADVVTDSFMKYFNSPQRYDPKKQTLEAFLVMDAEGDLKNEWEKLKRKSIKSVELDEKSGNNTIRDSMLPPDEQLINKETQQLLDEKLKALFNDETDIQLAQLMLSGERRSSEYARILCIGHLSETEQRHEIKKQKDRIDKTIKRKFRA